MAKTIRHTYLDFDGLCQLIWVPKLVTAPGPKENIAFRAYFTQIQPSDKDNKKPKRVGAAFRRDIPIGDILDIPIGTIFNNGIANTQYKDEDFNVREGLFALDLDDDNIRLIDRWSNIVSDEGTTKLNNFILPCSPASLPHDPDYNGTLLSIGAHGDPFAFLILSYEVFRFFYAVSSRMVQVFLDSRFVDWGRYVWNAERSSINAERKEALVWLRQWMLVQDAWFIASIAFDPIAVERGMNIYRSIATDKNRVLRAVPPMHESINVKAKYVSFKMELAAKANLFSNS